MAGGSERQARNDLPNSTPRFVCKNTDTQVAYDNMCSDIIYGVYFAQKHALLVVETFFAFPETSDTAVYFLLGGSK